MSEAMMMWVFWIGGSTLIVSFFWVAMEISVGVTAPQGDRQDAEGTRMSENTFPETKIPQCPTCGRHDTDPPCNCWYGLKREIAQRKDHHAEGMAMSDTSQMPDHPDIRFCQMEEPVFYPIRSSGPGYLIKGKCDKADAANDTSQIPLTHVLSQAEQIAAAHNERIAQLEAQVRALESRLTEVSAERDSYWRTARRLGQIEGDEAARRGKGQ